MKSFSRSLLIGTLALGACVVGRVARADEPTDSTDESLTEAPTQERDRGARGMHHMLKEVFEQLDLQPAQKAAIEAISSLTMKASAPIHAAKRDLALALADALAAGKVDKAALEPKVAAISAGSKCGMPILGAGFEEIHKILTPAQRAKFVDLVEKRIEKHQAKHEPGAMLEKVAKKLGLTDEQKEQLRPLLAAYEPVMKDHREMFRRVLEAFKGDSFSLEELVPQYDPAAHSRAVAAEMIDLTAQAAKILTPEQRARAAAFVREKATRHGDKEGKEGCEPSETGQPEKEPTGTSQEKLVWGGPYGAAMPGFGRWVAPGYGLYGAAYGFGYPYAYGYPYTSSFGLFW